MTISEAREVTVDDRYLLPEGEVFLSGTQALVRVILDQMRADRTAGLDTATMVSGYPGSPLGGFDLELSRSHRHAEPLNVVHKPGQNEELGATAVWGSQLVPSLPRPRHRGVLGVWYGKAPGVDRAADAFRHGNHVGAHPHGGLVALCGDDPTCKSSTLPSASESLLASLGMPVLYPGSVQELLDFGRHAVGLSRASGLWVALKAISDVVDGTGTVSVGAGRVTPIVPTVQFNGTPYRHVPNSTLLAPASLDMERTLWGPRLGLARAYAAANRLNHVTVNAPGAWLGIVAAGAGYYEVREAFTKLGLDDNALRALGIRLLKIGMLWPLEPEIVRDFASNLEELLVIEEKAPVLETALKDILYGTANAPRILGKTDENGKPLIPPTGGLDADLAARAIGARLRRKGLGEHVAAGLKVISRPAPLTLLGPKRTPFFCSGCPHNRSTSVPDNAPVAGGIGCHTMIVLNPEGKGEFTGMTQMGGEGAQWIGQAPFTDTPHIFQNLGDGTFHHSGSLAVRAAVGAGVNVTYKILYNSAVAMTGGQIIQPSLAVADLTRWLEIEGVRRVIVTTEELGRYRGVRLASIAEVRDRSALTDAQRELAEVPGVTVLIHDQQCAAERRRLRKRGEAPEPATRVAINRRVCEGCGDCGKKSECLSVLPIETEFGRKTEIHQSSCNKDYSCVEGDCPSFLTIVPGKKTKKRVAVPAPPALPLPEPVVTGEAVIRLVGIGGTGVVSVAQILGTAAMLDGKRSRGLDQTGLAQKGGTVVSDVRIFDGPHDRSGRASAASVDAYLALDLIGATDPKHLATADRERTVAVVSTSLVPTGAMVVDPSRHVTDLGSPIGALESRTRRELNVYFSAEELAKELFGDHMPANTLVVGAAWQRGLIPLSLGAIERAIRLSGGKAAERTLAAFHWGRAVVAAPESVERAGKPAEPVAPAPAPAEAALIESVGATPGGELHRLLTVRVPDLAAYQNISYAASYAKAVRAVLEEERAALPGGGTQVTEAYARHLHKLMAYKDEYEVARLHLDPVERARIAAEFGPGAKVAYNLHPPIFRAMGYRRKIRLGTWFDPAFKVLYGMRGLRGTKLDPFGLAHVRRTERRLIAEYTGDLRRAMRHLTPDTAERVVAVAELPDLIRGYEDIKLSGVAAYRERAAEALAGLTAAKEPAAGT
ncbi:indolepyruvate ferredoxin oxidoreductase family protein [Sinosporangium siamense]|uniref:Pyruvate ferredoxin/flavodoxin oxidoreductase n=1 Tax=Sinosporangium siamense TaxID=1367973 RepID=A0A919V9I5_9ACTN|nr:pyruvate ferredoxin/flavodoxin oxidoreductase [Sinosporangium siamense]